MGIDLKKEQLAALARPRYRYSAAARLFFRMMDLVTGSRTTLPKAKLIEMLAVVPYRSWERRQYARMSRLYGDGSAVAGARAVMEWGREAQDNEYRHLLVINEKMKEDGIKDPWYLFPAIPWCMAAGYAFLSGVMALVNIRRAFLFNAEFEDHAEHVYADFVARHPEWETQRVGNPVVSEYSGEGTWAGVFRRIGLDERDHMNNSFVFCGRPDSVVRYDGMPPLPEAPRRA